MGRPLRRRGFLLVLSLFLTILLFVLGLSFLGKRAAQYRRVSQAEQAARAKAMAEAGVEDFLVKFDRDATFPPMPSNQDAFSYSESVTDGTERLGGYTVTAVGTHSRAPYYVLKVFVTGDAGENASKPDAQRTMEMELDISPLERFDRNRDGDFNDPNPSFRQVMNFNDRGAF